MVPGPVTHEEDQMQIAERSRQWKEDESARLGAEIRRAMTRVGRAGSQAENLRIGKLIDRRIDLAFERALRSALRSAEKEKSVHSAR